MPTERDPPFWGGLDTRPDLSRHKPPPAPPVAATADDPPFTPAQEARIRRMIAEALATYAQTSHRAVTRGRTGWGV